MVIKDVDSKLIITKFAMQGYNVHPSAVEILKKEAKSSNIDYVISQVCKTANGSFIITPEDVLSILKKGKLDEQAERKYKINVLKDITSSSSCEGSIEDFVAYFNSRYEKLSKILRSRMAPTPIASLGRIKEKVDVIGMVSGIRESQRGNIVIEMEDKTGRVSVVASGKLKEIAMELLGDEVIGVTCSLKGRTIIADRITFPDVPANGRKIKKDFSIVFISDTHFGSSTFIQDGWETFVRWLNCEVGNEKMVELAESVKYIVLAGDIVEGVGVYPEQDKELSILDIHGQYEEAASQLDGIPKRIKVVLSPGNHDAVRQAEPQPALPSDFASLFSNNVIHVGNPAMLDIEEVKLLIYHGRSIDDLVTKIPRLDYSKSHKAMEELLKRRHLAPMYGNRSPVAPEREDYLVIDEIPDVLHSGHVHTYGTSFYKGVFVVNSSCWQSQTEFQKKTNLNPIPGNVTVYQPGGSVHRLKFYA
jgi:DNA polymerase II small subunit